MKKKYFPILPSKAGELVALENLSDDVKLETSPIIEIINDTFTLTTTMIKKGAQHNPKIGNFLAKHWSFPGNHIILDFSLFTKWHQYNQSVEQVLELVLNQKINIDFCVQRNSNTTYKAIVKRLIKKFGCGICIRSSNSSGGFYDYENYINEIVNDFEVEIANTSLLLDLGQISNNNFNVLVSAASLAIKSLRTNVAQWKHVIVASGSFPENLSGIPSSESEHKIPRYEWDAWNALIEVPELKRIKYSDYGTKAAIYSDVNFPGSVSLKYSSIDNYIIYRGELTSNHPDGHRQFINHSKNLVRIPEYSGSDFSWADGKYYELSLKDIDESPGNSTNWVQYSQNHHITLIHSIL